MAEPLPSDVFAHRVRAERERQRMSQAQLSRRMAQDWDTVVDPSAITRIEQQTRAVRLDEAVAIAGVLAVPLAALLAADDDGTQHELEARRAELAVVRAEWERLGEEMDRLTREIRALRGSVVEGSAD